MILGEEQVVVNRVVHGMEGGRGGAYDTETTETHHPPLALPTTRPRFQRDAVRLGQSFADYAAGDGNLFFLSRIFPKYYNF